MLTKLVRRIENFTTKVGPSLNSSTERRLENGTGGGWGRGDGNGNAGSIIQLLGGSCWREMAGKFSKEKFDEYVWYAMKESGFRMLSFMS